jgi:hypothetical protein
VRSEGPTKRETNNLNFSLSSLDFNLREENCILTGGYVAGSERRDGEQPTPPGVAVALRGAGVRQERDEWRHLLAGAHAADYTVTHRRRVSWRYKTASVNTQCHLQARKKAGRRSSTVELTGDDGGAGEQRNEQGGHPHRLARIFWGGLYMQRHICAHLALASERAKQGDGDAPIAHMFCFLFRVIGFITGGKLL